ISHGGALGVKKLNSATPLIQIQPRRLPHGKYVLHWLGCSQENDQLLREGRQRPHLRRSRDSGTIVANHARLAIPSKWWAIPLYSSRQGPGSDVVLREVLLDLRASRVRRGWGIFCPYLLTSRTLAQGKSRSNALGK